MSIRVGYLPEPGQSSHSSPPLGAAGARSGANDSRLEAHSHERSGHDPSVQERSYRYRYSRHPLGDMPLGQRLVQASGGRLFLQYERQCANSPVDPDPHLPTRVAFGNPTPAEGPGWEYR
jgi:hypothetical protein